LEVAVEVEEEDIQEVDFLVDLEEDILECDNNNNNNNNNNMEVGIYMQMRPLFNA
jgi:hypothetical protein